ncbi:MAG: acetoacetate--CoA ligase [Chitinophagaceae bacterium]|nr:acetoacetate--CoA ligase [Chitinophagaceae bacterium]
MEPITLWTPSASFRNSSNLAHYANWLRENAGLSFVDYPSLWKWSVAHPADFWKSISDYFAIIHHSPYKSVVSDDSMPHTKWFEGSTLNYAEHVFRNANKESLAILFQSERQILTSITWQELEQKTAALQQFFLRQGIRPGDRIAGYLPCIPEATICLLAALSLGAVWTSCSPDFGSGSVMDRFQQVEPSVLIAVDGYTYNGKPFDRREEVKKIAAAIPSLKKTIMISYLDTGSGTGNLDNTVLWDDVIQPVKEPLQFIPVAFDHPAWILYSSGTTGIPKAITHGHGGVLLEHYKYLVLQNDVKKGERFFWFTTTGWMMWNFVNAALLAGATIVLYDGSPGYPNLDVLWKLAEAAPVQHFGTSAPYIMACKKAGISPGQSFGLSSLRSISSTGSPLPPEGFDYVYENIKRDVWLCSMSGGTDVCTAFVGGNPWTPVYEGEIQGRALGCELYAYDDNGKEVYDEVGEMVIAGAMPSMPVFFWNDPGFKKYTESYFDTYPGVWRHGDWVKITPREGVVILGRSDATLNRQGVRIGTAEIYRAIDTIAQVKDSLVLNIEQPGGGDYMPLFVVMKEGEALTDEVRNSIKNALRTAYSPRHVPDEMIKVDDIPYTISGKKMEMPVKKILMGKPVDKSVNKGSVKNPGSLAFFIEFAQTIKRKTDLPG